MGDGFGFLLFFSYDFFKNGAPVRKESKPRGPKKKKKYNEFLVSGKLQRYLAQIDRDAQEMFDLLICQLAEQEGVTEQLKSANQMECIAKMNSIRSRVTEIVNHELIYT